MKAAALPARAGSLCTDKASEQSGLAVVEQMLRSMNQPLRELAQRAGRMGPNSGGAVVMVTGNRRGAGCSSVALALAAAAGGDQSVVLIDGDLMQAGLSDWLNGAPDLGWEESVRGLRPLDNTVHRWESWPELPFLPLRQPIADPVDVLRHPGMPAWLATLRRGFSLAVLDGGLVHDTGRLWAPWVDVAVLVCDSGRALLDDWAGAWDRLEEGGAHVLGIVETFA